MSYVSQQFLVMDNSTLANFKSWAQAISVALSTSGWAQTSDTGQVNWSSIASVPSSTYVYEVWKPTDALQTGSSQFFLLVEYGFATSTLRLRLSVGTGTNGSGTLTGFVIGPANFNVASQGLSPYECNFSGDINRFCMMLWRTNGNGNSPIFAIERTHNTDGTDNATGVTYMYPGAGLGGGALWQSLVFGVGLGPSQVKAAGIFYTAGETQNATFNNQIAVSPVFPQIGSWGNPVTSICYVSNSLVAEGSLWTTTIYGATRTYITTTNTNSRPNGNAAMLGMRYD